MICIGRVGRDIVFSTSDTDRRLPTSTCDTGLKNRLPTLSTPRQSDTFWRHRKKNRLSRAKFQQKKTHFLNVDLKKAKS